MIMMTHTGGQCRKINFAAAFFFLSALFSLLIPIISTDSSCNFTIEEETKMSKVVGELPLPKEGEENYNIIEPNHYFHVNSLTGRIGLKSTIDREKICPQTEVVRSNHQCTLDLNVLKNYAKKKPPLLMPLKICIVDINDNPPVLPHGDEQKIPENVEIGHKIALKPATDADDFVNSVKQYGLTCDNDSPKTFDVIFNETENSNSVSLVVLRALDHESRSNYQCIITANDGKHSSEGRLYIFVTDVNDHAPKWSPAMGNFTISIKEGVSPYQVIFHLKATDGDSDYGVVNYKISDQVNDAVHKTFGVTQAGVVQTKMRLDYEDKTKSRVYEIPVVAFDNGALPYSATATLTVSLIDENDNYPIISSLVHDPIRIQENEEPGFLSYFTVNDADSGANGEVSCGLVNHDNQFELKLMHPNFYAIHSKEKFDREKGESFVLTVTCKDKGQPMKKQSKDFNVYIRDLNDNAPKFSQRHYTIYVNEETDSKDRLFRPSVYDPDKNPRLKYSLRPPEAKKYVYIDSEDGDVFQVKRYDREQQANYTFEIVVTDGMENHTDTANITLIVLDINDHEPKFLNAYSFNVKENKAADTIVGRVIAEDKDEGMSGTVSYRIADRSASRHFKMSDDGVIRLIHPLDREVKDNYHLVIQALDHGTPRPHTSTTTVVINVEDDNDSPPRYPESSYMRNIPCNQHLLVTDIRATDEDIDPNNHIQYRLLRVLPNVTTPQFQVDLNNGEILMQDSPDNCRDVTTSYRLYIQAYDPQKEEFHHNITVTVNLLRNYEGANNNYGSGGKYWNNNRRQRKGDNYSQLISDTNLLIVVILVCVSVLLAVLMLALIIYLKRRQDREAQYEKGNSSPDMEEPPGTFSTFQKRSDSGHYLTTLCPINKNDVCLQDVRGTFDTRNKPIGCMEKNNLRAAHSADNLYMTDSLCKPTGRGGTLERTLKSKNIGQEDLYHDYQAMIPTSPANNVYYESAKPFSYSVDQPYTEFHPSKFGYMRDDSIKKPSPNKNQNQQVVSFDLSNNTAKDDFKTMDAHSKQKKAFSALNRGEKGPYFTISFV